MRTAFMSCATMERQRKQEPGGSSVTDLGQWSRSVPRDLTIWPLTKSHIGRVVARIFSLSEHDPAALLITCNLNQVMGRKDATKRAAEANTIKALF